jgi:hypothetical protein
LRWTGQLERLGLLGETMCLANSASKKVLQVFKKLFLQFLTGTEEATPETSGCVG